MTTGSPEPNRIHQEYAEALKRGGDAEILLGDVVLCDSCSTDLTNDARSGGFMFSSYAYGPCCAERPFPSIESYREGHSIPGGVPDACHLPRRSPRIPGPHPTPTVLA